ncbi:phosphoribulokinase/uridine kinase [Periconia macrospinosa]|uniref:Phosphoribulokinase/uridine kinase n=1 Tax=Periconia macrospinosa TaxID=97972 RepID=A0A2V1DCI0_9PLEO|nr:phosphoribulokinase/uridine kinase [Periconia macrospinosa]
MAKELHDDVLVQPISGLVKRVKNLFSHQTADSRERILIALAGVPGSGKSAISHALLKELELQGIHGVEVAPLDGFHYTQKALSNFDDPDLAFRRRGAPFTFDAEAFVNFTKTLKSIPITITNEPESIIHAPSFDHAIKDPVQDGIQISSRTRLIIVEGNYTLLNQRSWCEIADLCDEKYVMKIRRVFDQADSSRWFVDVPADVVRDRLAKRHLAAGIESTMAQAIKRAEENDLPNGDLIRALLIKPDVIIDNP